MRNLSAFIIGLATVLILGIGGASAATFTVTKSANSNDGVCDADCSLREAVAAADSGDLVNFDHSLVGQTFTLGGAEIVVTKRITIDGHLNNPSVAFISGTNTSRIFFIETGGALDLRNAILVGGNGTGLLTPSGGAIFANNNSALSLDRVAIRQNSATFLAGAILGVQMNLHMVNTSITANSVTTCVAICVTDSTVTMANVTISGNIDNDPDDADEVGVVGLFYSNTTIRNSTIAHNYVGRSALVTATKNNPSTLDIGNTIVAENVFTVGGDIDDLLGDSTMISSGGNLIGSTNSIPADTYTQPNDILGANPLLGPINSNLGGHPVEYHPLQAGSPARNAGINSIAVDPLTNAPLTTDARGAGFSRILDATVDKGAFEDASGNTSLIVTKNANSNDLVCDIDCSLREAVHQASLNFGTDTITFAPNVFGIVPLGGSEIVIQNQNVNIIGLPNLNANVITISGENTSRIFRLNNATVHLAGLTLADGNGIGGSGNFGGAVLAENSSDLTLDHMIVANNFAAAYGALYLSGGTGRLLSSTISTNSANTGLAIAASGTLYMANTTVSGNFDADGGPGIGALFITGTANIRNSTIAFNRTAGGTGGGIFSAGTLNIGNSIVANNIAAVSPDIERSSGVITSVGGNLVRSISGFPVGNFSQTNDATGIDPMIAGAVADNGGCVTTHLLMPGSPAINTGINAGAVDPFDGSPLLFDARGNVSRILNVTVDKGAFEASGPTAAVVSVAGRVTKGKLGVDRARVFITGQDGETSSVLTNSFGYFQFDHLQAGETYIVGVTAKNLIFMTQVVSIIDEMTELDFSAQAP